MRPASHFIAMAILAFPSLGLSDARSQDPPNILVILADDLGYSDLGCYGGEIDTPHIDGLAAEGVKLTQMYNSARCCPSRASLMTGLYPSQAGIGDFTTPHPSPTRGPGYLGRLNDQCLTLAEVLKPVGYACYYVGKWHLHEETGPIQRGFDEFYGYTRGHSHDQYDADYYVRLPKNRRKEIDPDEGEFYATQVFNDYAIEFIKQGQATGQPWFVFLGHSSPHFPLQAPADRADKYEPIYRRGWDVLRKERFERMQQLGLVDGSHWQLPDREIVPVDRDDIANGYAGQPNPAWDSLSDERQHDLARRMSIFAAMVEGVDQGVGAIVEHLRSTQDLENTLILFLSDNGACYEWGPFGFDGTSRTGQTTLRTGDQLREIGGPGTHQSYGSGWANLGNTPFRLYKHFTHEGGISMPFIACWPRGIAARKEWIRQPGHVLDVMPTLLEAAGAQYPKQHGGQAVTPLEGTSLLPVLRGESAPDRTLGFDHQAAHALRQGDWKAVYSKRMPHDLKWELYNLAEDRCELRDVADNHPERLAKMRAQWETWARRVGVTWQSDSSIAAAPTDLKAKIAAEKSPSIARCNLHIEVEVDGARLHGVALAQGGNQHGYAVHFIDGRPVFDVRVDGNVRRLAAQQSVSGKTRLIAELDAQQMRLTVNEQPAINAPSPGLFPVQPVDALSIAHDARTAAGNYAAPNRFQGKVLAHRVQATTAPAKDRPNTPYQSKLITQWGEELTAENAWTEYPRPQLRRPAWTNLNGHWDYAITPDKERELPSDWAGHILVPFCLESRLGGVQRLLNDDEALWYHRQFDARQVDGKRLQLHFEAVDYACEVFVNGTSVGTHQGGHTPFTLDVTQAVRDGINDLIVRVEDETEGYQLRGKQSLNARGIWYTQVSGIWQTVWLEEVPEQHIQDIKITTDPETGEISVTPIATQPGMVRLVVKVGERTVAEVQGKSTLTARVPKAKLWSPADPHLYDLEVTLLDQDGALLDRVYSYTGIRRVGKVRDADGHWRFTLNGEILFHWGPLDQGWWPDGLLTPPSDEAMLYDIEWLKAAGFNMIRKHIKVEPRRYYYHCDRLGMMVWQDQVSGGTQEQGWPEWTRLKPNPVDAVWPQEQHQQYMLELERMIDTLENHPAIVCWVPFNERWGQHRTAEVGRWTVARDPSRLVNVASGGNFWPVGDIVDEHRYPHPGFPFELNAQGRFDEFIKVMGEFGGHGYPVEGHLWDTDRRNWGYGGLPKNADEYRERYETSLAKLDELRRQGIAAGVYTQTTDVEGEINGLLTYDRKVVKIPAAELAKLHQVLLAPTDAEPADQFPDSAFRETQTDRQPGPVMDAETIRSGLKSHDRALYIKAGWIRDPYITLGPDAHYYLTGTQPAVGDPREQTNPYNIGLGDESIVGDQVRVYRSPDLITWEDLGPVFTLDDTWHARRGKPLGKRLIWAPELHWMGDRWALVHCPRRHSSLALSSGQELAGPWVHPMQGEMGQRHDPSLFTDDDGTVWMLWQNTMIAPLSEDLSEYTAAPVRIDPAGTRPGPDGKPIGRIGHEGATMIKVGGKYVHLGTAWSTDQGRQGSYNLYYCVADEITGPYGPRRFAGRFLGHGTPFQDKQGRWWCTAFFNANVPPEAPEGIATRDLGDNARTINEQGVTIVPLDIRQGPAGEISIRAKDPAYANPGPDEAQQFELVEVTARR